MKEKIDELMTALSEDSKLSKLDVLLGTLVALFSGILLGMLLSPRKTKTQYFGCGNGNNYAQDDECEGCDCDECGECSCEGGLCCKEDCDEERCCGEHEFCGKDELCCQEDFSDEEFSAEDVKIAEEAAQEAEEETAEKSYVKIR